FTTLRDQIQDVAVNHPIQQPKQRRFTGVVGSDEKRDITIESQLCPPEPPKVLDGDTHQGTFKRRHLEPALQYGSAINGHGLGSNLQQSLEHRVAVCHEANVRVLVVDLSVESHQHLLAL